MSCQCQNLQRCLECGLQTSGLELHVGLAVNRKITPHQLQGVLSGLCHTLVTRTRTEKRA